jgi:hypothetical protein
MEDIDLLTVLGSGGRNSDFRGGGGGISDVTDGASCTPCEV